MKSVLNLFSVLRFNDMIEINYPNNDVLAVLPCNGKEKFAIKTLYKEVLKKENSYCKYNEEIIKMEYGDCR